MNSQIRFDEEKDKLRVAIRKLESRPPTMDNLKGLSLAKSRLKELIKQEQTTVFTKYSNVTIPGNVRLS